MSSADSTVLIVRNASVWLCENGRTEYEGYIRSISPLGFTAALSARFRPSTTVEGTAPSGQPIPDLASLLIGRKFVAALCGRDYSTIVDATATEIQKLTGSAFDFTVTCRFNHAVGTGCVVKEGRSQTESRARRGKEHATRRGPHERLRRLLPAALTEVDPNGPAGMTGFPPVGAI